MEYCKFLEHYRKYSSGNETPELMHLWVGLSVLAGACEKRLWIDQGYFRLYLNLYVILLAPAGVCAKSTSMDLGAKLLKEAGYTTMEGSITKEKIIEDMAGLLKSHSLSDGTLYPHTPVTYISNELNVLLSSGTDMVKFLVDIWDRDESYAYKTKTSGTFEITYPYFNMLSAAVPQWFGGSVANDMGATGFLARCIIIYQDKKRGKYPRVVITPEQVTHREFCLSFITGMASQFGSVKLTEAADKFYCDWYMVQEPLVTDDYRVQSYIERRTKVHMLKVAALMAIGDGRSEIDVIDLERCLHLLARTEEFMRLAYAAAGTNSQATHIHHILTMVRAQPDKRMALKEVVRATYTEIDANTMRGILETMESLGYLKQVMVGPVRYLEAI